MSLTNPKLILERTNAESAQYSFNSSLPTARQWFKRHGSALITIDGCQYQSNGTQFVLKQGIPNFDSIESFNLAKTLVNFGGSVNRPQQIMINGVIGLYNGNDFSPNVASNNIQVVPTFSDLQGAQPSSNGLVIRQGYYNKGDTKQFVYYWDPISTLTPNTGNIVQVSGITVGRWISKDTSEYIDAEMFGVRAGQGIDNTDNLNAAIAYSESLSLPKLISLPSGSIRFVKGNIQIRKGGCGLIGAGKINTVLQFIPSQTNAVDVLGVITGGSGYTNGFYPQVTLSLVSGTAPTIYPTANITVTGGAVSNVELISFGDGIIDNSTVFGCPASAIGGTGSGFSVPILSSKFICVSFGTTTNSLLYQSKIAHLAIYGPGSTSIKKVGLQTIATSQLIEEEITIKNFIGNDSICRHTFGHELQYTSECYWSGDIPLRISPNPIVSGLGLTPSTFSTDHFIFNNIYYLASDAPTLGGTTPTTCILIDNGVQITNLSFTGKQALVGGQRGLYNLDTSSSVASYMVDLENIRREQASAASNYDIYISRPQLAKIQELKIDMGYFGQNQKGFYLRGINYLTFVHVKKIGSVEQLNIDFVDSLLMLSCQFSSTNPLDFIMPNMALVDGNSPEPARYLPTTCSWMYTQPTLLYQQKAKKDMNGANEWSWSGQLANTTSQQIPINLTNGYSAAILNVVAVATDGSQFEAGTWAIGNGTQSSAVLVGGSGYTNGTYTNVPMTLSSGTSWTTYPTATIVVSGGAVTSVTLNNTSCGYVYGSVLTTAASNIGGTGTGFTYTPPASYWGVSLISGTPKCKISNIAGNLIVYNSNVTTLMGTINIYNRLGVTCNIVAKATLI